MFAAASWPCTQSFQLQREMPPIEAHLPATDFNSFNIMIRVRNILFAEAPLWLHDFHLMRWLRHQVCYGQLLCLLSSVAWRS